MLFEHVKVGDEVLIPSGLRLRERVTVQAVQKRRFFAGGSWWLKSHGGRWGGSYDAWAPYAIPTTAKERGND